MDNGEWVEGNLFVSDTDGRTYILAGSRTVTIEWEVDPETVGQYIGIEDKNDQMIFVGDILEHDGIRFVVKYFQEYCRFGCSRPRMVCFGLDFELFDKIGNIHDNPELMEGGAAE